MKKSVAITAVLALHVAAIGILLAQPGCSSEPEQPKLGSATATTTEIPEKKVASDLNDGAPAPDAAPAPEKLTPPEGSLALRAAPTRPVWDMAPSSGEVVVEDKDAVAPKSDKIGSEKKSTVVYIVKKGDTIAKIARKHKITKAELIKENDLTAKSMLKIGQTLSIPANAEAVVAPVVKPAEVKSAPQGEESETYIVKRGDSLGKIAKRHGMSVSTLKAINSLSSDTIKIGQKLTVAKGAAEKVSTAKETVASNKTVTSAAKTEVAPEGEEIVVVKAGDTLGKIAIRYGTSSRAIMKRNGITDARKLRVGKKLFVPTKAAKKSEQANAAKPVETVAQPVAIPTATTSATAPVEQPLVTPDAKAPSATPAPVQTAPQTPAPVNTEKAPATTEENISVTDIG